MKAVKTLLLSALLPLSTLAASAPPLLPATLSLTDLPVAAGSLREFDIDLPRTEKRLAWEVNIAGTSARLSGTFRVSMPNGTVLHESVLDGRVETGGQILVPSAATARRLRISLGGGADAMQADLRLSHSFAQLKPGQPVPVFARLRGSEKFEEVLEMRLAKPSDIDLRTWGGDASVKLTVKGPMTDMGFPPPVCEDEGDAWRRCVLPGAADGLYHVTVEGTGAAVQLMGSWPAVVQP